MKFTDFTIAVFLLATVTVSQAESSRNKQKTEDSKTEKRALIEGNAGVEKRTPVLPTALPQVSPGIEYADSKDLENEKSPQQTLYATPIPQLAKISDVLTGQGPPFQAAIASHLFSPVSIYQPRLSSPTYEVSAPVPAQLIYSEKSFQPTPQQFTPQVFKQKTNLRFLQPQQYQALPQPLITPQLPPQPVLPDPQIFQIPQQYQQQLYFNPQLQYQQQVPQQQFIQQHLVQQQIPQQQILQQQIPQQHLVQQAIPQQQIFHQQIAQLPGIVYSREEEQKAIQRELKTAPSQVAHPLQNLQEKTAQGYNTQPQGAISFASFSVGPPAQNQAQYQQQPNQAQYQEQTQAYQNDQYQKQNQAQNQAPQQFQPQIQQYQTQNIPTQPQLRQYQIQRQPLPQNNPFQSYQYQPQNQIQIQPQVLQKLEPSPANSISVQTKLGLNAGKDEYRPSPVPLYQPNSEQLYQAQNFVPQQQYGNQALAVPTFPPVQFFGKFAHTLFRQYQQ